MPTEPPAISVVLPARNASHLIGHQLEALARQRPGVRWELIVVDNGSTDATVSVVEAYRSVLPLRIVHHAPQGVAGSRNAGVLSARAPLIAHCDADDVVSDDWLAALVVCLDRYPIVAGALDEVALNQANPWSKPRIPRDRLPVALEHLPYAVGANIAYRREVHTTTGGWDARFRRGCDDVDFSWRAVLAGFEIGICTGAVIHYRHRHSGFELARQFFGYGHEETLLLKRHRGSGALRPSLADAANRWWRQLRRTPAALRHRQLRRDWVATTSWLCGRAVGSIRHRSLLL